MKRRPYLPGAEVWRHPDAERVFATINKMRTEVYKTSPLAREKTSTEDVLRERLQEQDKHARWMRRHGQQAQVK